MHSLQPCQAILSLPCCIPVVCCQTHSQGDMGTHRLWAHLRPPSAQEAV